MTTSQSDLDEAATLARLKLIDALYRAMKEAEFAEPLHKRTQAEQIVWESAWNRVYVTLGRALSATVS